SISKEGDTLAFTRAALTFPAEVYVVTGLEGGSAKKETASVRNLSKANSRLLAQLDLPEPESVTVKGAGGTPMQMWILKPPGFDASKKWPVVYLVHGGPQGVWSDSWSFRWCPQVWAARGYVVALPNPRVLPVTKATRPVSSVERSCMTRPLPTTGPTRAFQMRSRRSNVPVGHAVRQPPASVASLADHATRLRNC
ncbi:MAG TPA: hypothetical protein PJ982_06920, partial [Lacipirellulaceae bacterium]|nr:hypothetical protein [Lacipirellulaceae bacterium]